MKLQRGGGEQSDSDLASLVGQHQQDVTHLDKQHPVVTYFNLQGLQDGATVPAIVDSKEDSISNPQSKLLH
jgi:hypothetical protein